MSKVKTLYACGVDWQHEIGVAPDLEGSMPLYSSIEELKANRECYKQCGIVRLRLRLEEWELEQDLWGENSGN